MDYGYLVKAKVLKDDGPKDMLDCIARRMDNKFGKVVSYYQYKK